MAQATGRPKLYSYHGSSSSYRVRIALALKGIEYDYVPIDIAKGTSENKSEQFSEEFIAINPISQVPCLVIDDAVLTESVAIMEYLEEARPEVSPLLPNQAVQRAQVRRLVEMVNAGIQPLQNLAPTRYIQEKLGLEAKKEWNLHFIGRGLSALEKAVQLTKGRYCVGDQVTLADVVLIPQLYGSVKRGVDTSQFPNLKAIEAECLQLPAFQSAHPEKQPDYSA
eukprot:jgi/Chlat1/6908/Chrsp52S06588